MAENQDTELTKDNQDNVQEEKNKFITDDELKDDLDKFYKDKDMDITDELLLLRKEFRDIDADQREIFDGKIKVQDSPKNEDGQKERKDSFFNRVSIKKLAKDALAFNITDMPSQLIDTSKDLKNKLYDHRQNRH